MNPRKLGPQKVNDFTVKIIVPPPPTSLFFANTPLNINLIYKGVSSTCMRNIVIGSAHQFYAAFELTGRLTKLDVICIFF